MSELFKPGPCELLPWQKGRFFSGACEPNPVEWMGLFEIFFSFFGLLLFLCGIDVGWALLLSWARRWRFSLAETTNRDWESISELEIKERIKEKKGRRQESLLIPAEDLNPGDNIEPRGNTNAVSEEVKESVN